MSDTGSFHSYCILLWSPFDFNVPAPFAPQDGDGHVLPLFDFFVETGINLVTPDLYDCSIRMLALHFCKSLPHTGQ